MPSAPTPRSSAGQRRLWSTRCTGHGRRLARLRRRSPSGVHRPVLGSTVHPEDFLFTLTNGDQVVPNSAGLVPNWELNERNTVVVFGDFGNRGAPGEADAVYPAKLEIVDDGTPLRFLGPDGEESGVGLTWEGQGATGYGTGPQLVGAKLNHVGDAPAGEGGAPSSNGRCCPTTSSRSTAAVTSACACSPRVASPRLGSPGSPPTPTNTTSECTRRRGRFDRPALRERGRLQGRRGHAASPWSCGPWPAARRRRCLRRLLRRGRRQPDRHHPGR